MAIGILFILEKHALDINNKYNERVLTSRTERGIADAAGEGAAGGHGEVAEALAGLGCVGELPRRLEDALHPAPARQGLSYPAGLSPVVVGIVAEYRCLVVARAVAAVATVADDDLVLVARRRRRAAVLARALRHARRRRCRRLPGQNDHMESYEISNSLLVVHHGISA